MEQPEEDSFVGRRVGNWRLIRLIGEGGYGSVYEAENAAIAGRRAAVKILHPRMSAHREMKQRFLNEASAASRAEHENIVQVFDGGISDDGVCYSVMELLRGRTLTSTLASGPLGVERAVRMALQVADALAAAHDLGVVHRDLKPDNIFLVGRAGNPEFVKVLDFGVAKLRDEVAGSGRLTNTGAMIGTPGYMSPEQWKSLPDIDGRADVYALGMIIYRCITGALPLHGTTQYEWLWAHLHQPIPSLAEVADVPPALAELVARMVAKERDERPRTMLEVRTALREVGAGGAAAAPAWGAAAGAAPLVEPTAGRRAGATPTPSSDAIPIVVDEPEERPPLRPRSSPARAALVSAAVVAVASAGGYLAWRYRAGAPERGASAPANTTGVERGGAVAGGRGADVVEPGGAGAGGRGSVSGGAPSSAAMQHPTPAGGAAGEAPSAAMQHQTSGGAAGEAPSAAMQHPTTGGVVGEASSPATQAQAPGEAGSAAMQHPTSGGATGEAGSAAMQRQAAPATGAPPPLWPRTTPGPAAPAGEARHAGGAASLAAGHRPEGGGAASQHGRSGASPGGAPRELPRLPAGAGVDDGGGAARRGAAGPARRDPADDSYDGAPAPGEDPTLPLQLGQADLDAGMAPVYGGVNDCFRQFKLSDSVMVAIAIAPTGRIDSATVRGPLSGTPAGQCLLAAIHRASFKRFRGRPMTIVFSFPQ